MPSIHWTETGTSVHTQLKDRESAKTSTLMSSAIIIEETVALSDKIIVIRRLACTTWRLRFRLNGKLNYDLKVSSLCKNLETESLKAFKIQLHKVDTEFILVNVFTLLSKIVPKPVCLFNVLLHLKCLLLLSLLIYLCFDESTKKAQFRRAFFPIHKARSSHYPQTYIICSANEQSDGRTRIGRQQNGDTYTLEISFPAVKYVLG